MADMLAAALQLAGRNLFVFPCLERGKSPATQRGLLNATTDQFIIRQWWAHNERFNIGVACGPGSKIFAVDVDVDTHGEAALAKLEAEHGALPPSVEAVTGSGGRHVLFQYPEDLEIPNSAGKLGHGLDIRGRGGFVIVPPSVHPNGRAYCWSVDSADRFAPAPRWLLDLIASDTDHKPAVAPEEWRAISAGVAEGARNGSIARLTGYLLRHGIDPAVTRDLMVSWNSTHCSPPLPDREVVRTINSICSRELKRRGWS